MLLVSLLNNTMIYESIIVHELKRVKLADWISSKVIHCWWFLPGRQLRQLHGVHTYRRVDRTSVPVTKSEAGTRSTQPGHLSLKCVSTRGVNSVLQYAIFIQRWPSSALLSQLNLRICYKWPFKRGLSILKWDTCLTTNPSLTAEKHNNLRWCL